MLDMSDSQFEKYNKLIYDNFGIALSYSKKEAVQSKVRKLMFRANIKSYEEYYGLLTQSQDRKNWTKFVDEITIHKTDFFRENTHFEYIKNNMNYILKSNPRISSSKEIRVWSAGCSTGEEPYTIAIVLNECVKNDMKIKVLGTDISSKVIETAQKGKYSIDSADDIDEYYLKKYFTKEEKSIGIIPNIKNQVIFRTFNLTNTFPFKNVFDIIFCRNVMIYFDSKVQEKLIRKFYDVLAPGGLLFIGHSESLIGRQYRFQYIHPTIYMRSL